MEKRIGFVKSIREVEEKEDMGVKSLIKKLLPSYRTYGFLNDRLDVLENKIDRLVAENERLFRENNRLFEENSILIDEVRWIRWQHLGRYLMYTAAMETSRFIIDNMPRTKAFEDKFGLLHYAIDNAKINGLYLEFGVFSGETINFISDKVKCKVYGFDSFEGLPEDWRSGYEQGTFDIQGALPKVNDNVELVKGWFDQSLPVFINQHRENCALIHIDCDLYSSTKTVFELLKDRIVPGTIIVFDEYFNYPDWQNGEYKAFMEFVKDNDLKFEYLGYSMIEQVAIKIL